MFGLARTMRIYLVGGAVRDQLLGFPVKERDWLAIGVNEKTLLDQGYQSVGKDFTVYLHPDTHEEYALPRGGASGKLNDQERVALDLKNRDLTINAMAFTEDGQLIDPLNGKADIKAGVLRHTPSFHKDPIRILRLARFAARYKKYGFKVADETRTLIIEMAAGGQLNALTPERIWSEMRKALDGENPRQFFETLNRCEALKPLIPELDALFGVPQPVTHHPEIDTGVHTMMALEQAERLSSDSRVRFAVLCHDLGKGTTLAQEWPRHIGHEKRGARLINGLCKRLRIPNSFRDIARLVAIYHGHCHRAHELKAATLLKVFTALDAFRRPQRLEQFLLACEADFKGRKDHELCPYPQADLLHAAIEAATGIDNAALVAKTQNSKKIPELIKSARIKAISRRLSENRNCSEGKPPSVYKRSS